MADWRPEQILALLVEQEVDFVVIGGAAVIAQGFVRATKDTDICFERSTTNLDRLATVLRAVNARLRGAEEVPIPLDARFLRNLSIVTLVTDWGDLDCLALPDGVSTYEELRAAADWMEIGGVKVRVASIEDLIRMKRAAGRPQDLHDIEALEVVQRVQTESQPSNG